MEATPKEGAGRPLYSSAPDSPAGGPSAAGAPRPALPPSGGDAANPAWRPGPGFLQAALLSYPLAWFYTRWVLFAGTDSCRWSMPAFAVLYLLGVSLLARAQTRPALRESLFWAVCWLVQCLAIALYGAHDVMWLWQWLAWHATAVYWTMCRTGMLAAGKSGIWAPLDLLLGVTALPWRDFLLRVRTLLHGAGACLRRAGSASRRRAAGGVFSAVVALVLCMFAWNQLAAVDGNFARLADRLLGWLDLSFISPDDVLYLVLSLPVGAWLFGLAGGGLRRTAPPVPDSALQKALAMLPRLPGSTGYVVPGALCAVYTLFFALQAWEFAAALGSGALTAAAASDFAVTGFWELCSILLLDFAVLAALELLGGPLRAPGKRRLLLTLFNGYGLAFALLAAAKLGAYIWLYGPTPRRVLSGWFLAVLAVWCALALVWLWRPVPAARIGVLVLAGSFALLCCLPVEKICVDENLRRYTAGQIETVDTALMAQCGSAQGRMQEYITRRLLDAGWFTGRTADEISEMFYIRFEDYRDAERQDGSGYIRLSDLPGASAYVQLTFRDGLCTAAALRTEGAA